MLFFSFSLGVSQCWMFIHTYMAKVSHSEVSITEVIFAFTKLVYSSLFQIKAF